MDMVFNYLPDVFYQSLRHHNYENSWLNETTNEGKLTQLFSKQNTATLLFPATVPRTSRGPDT